jgi:flagellar hook-length control protein FliK
MLPPLSEGIKPEQFRAAQQMTQATISTPVKPENLFQEMISRVETMQNDTKSTMTIQLNPEFLGKVALEVAVDAAGLHVKINAEDSGVRNMINSQLTALIESLESKGIEVVEVEVAYTGNNFNASQDPRESAEQQSKRQRPTNREISAADGIALYTTLPDLHDYYQDVGVSSVEYSA